MRYAYGMSYPQLVGTLRHSVKFQDQLSLHFTPNLFLKDEFVGNVEGDNISWPGFLRQDIAVRRWSHNPRKI